ncbi:MAG: exodeoxyribonuclease VII small subunit [Clostridia bacterium]|nr:exodeoxyribonuclease VII small subunit [Clostridia bacterium]
MDEKIIGALGEQSLETLMKRIDDIAKQLGGEEISLEQSLALYEEGIALIRICNDKLGAAERKIKMLKISDGGEIEETEVSSLGE